MRSIEGWLDDAEANLLISAVEEAASLTRMTRGTAIVEVGSYCGRSSVVLGLTLKGLRRYTPRIYAIDPHEGVVSTLDGGITHLEPTFERFMQNLRKAGLAKLIKPIRAQSLEVEWSKPIVLLFLDGLHDYAHVAADFHHFSPWLIPGGLVVFHDCTNGFPGVKQLVREVLGQGDFVYLGQVHSLALLQKLSATCSRH
jgi:predicted O-methyltransferase YrrM